MAEHLRCFSLIASLEANRQPDDSELPVFANVRQHVPHRPYGADSAPVGALRLYALQVPTLLDLLHQHARRARMFSRSRELARVFLPTRVSHEYIVCFRCPCGLRNAEETTP